MLVLDRALTSLQKPKHLLYQIERLSNIFIRLIHSFLQILRRLLLSPIIDPKPELNKYILLFPIIKFLFDTLF